MLDSHLNSLNLKMSTTYHSYTHTTYTNSKIILATCTTNEFTLIYDEQALDHIVAAKLTGNAIKNVGIPLKWTKYHIIRPPMTDTTHGLFFINSVSNDVLSSVENNQVL